FGAGPLRLVFGFSVGLEVAGLAMEGCPRWVSALAPSASSLGCVWVSRWPVWSWWVVPAGCGTAPSASSLGCLWHFEVAGLAMVGCSHWVSVWRPPPYFIFNL